MGHIRLGVLPGSKKWQQVVEELSNDTHVASLARSTANAAEFALSNAVHDRALGDALWLLTHIPLAARGPDYAEDLSALGLDLPGAPSLFEVTAAIRAPNTEHALRRPGADDLAIKPTSASQIGFREPLTGSF